MRLSKKRLGTLIDALTGFSLGYVMALAIARWAGLLTVKGHEWIIIPGALALWIASILLARYEGIEERELRDGKK